MEEKDFFDILQKYLKGKASPEEEDFIRTYYDLFDLKPDAPYLNEKENQLLKNSIQADLHRKIRKENIHKKHIRLYQQFSIAATILVVLSVIYYFNFSGINKSPSGLKQIVKTRSDIKPGSNKAILTLGDGKRVALDNAPNGVLAKQGSIEVRKIADGHLTYVSQKGSAPVSDYNTVTTPRAGQFQLTLPDGSRVWLNAASSIRFPTSFSEKFREVTITGEVYFEVAKDKHKPFRVISQGQLIEVLGTHFNVNTYADEPVTKTTLLEGSVKVSTSTPLSGKKLSSFLTPGFQASNQNGKITITEADTESAVAWKNGYFRFKRENIQTVMRQISRWYDVEVEYSGPAPTDEFVGRISRSSNISTVLRILSFSKVNCKLEGNKIIIHN